MGSKLLVCLALVAGCVDAPAERSPVRSGSGSATTTATVTGNAEACAKMLAAYNSDDQIADLDERGAAGWDGLPDPCEGVAGVDATH